MKSFECHIKMDNILCVESVMDSQRGRVIIITFRRLCGCSVYTEDYSGKDKKLSFFSSVSG